MTSTSRTSFEPLSSLTSEPDRFSDDAWELLLSGQDVARRWRHQDLDVEHLLQVLFSDERYRRVAGALPLPIDRLLDQLEGFLAEQPMARGEDLFVGEDLESLLEESDRVRSLWGSRLIDVSHLLIAMGRDPRVGAELFAQFGLPADRLEAELTRAPDRSPSSVVAPPAPRPRPPSASAASASMPPAQMPPLQQPSVQQPSVQQPSAQLQQGQTAASPQPQGDGIDRSVELVNEPTALESYGRDLTAAAGRWTA
jgi:ATP-dependent Clp protease ATP-binding subunit ClpA